ncbi:DNA topoisomerase 3-beta-1-like [Anneissia japonica]|uniref:DNA topoisomerase 3-beta-1-like n=1 Tax=Anneissia japonica TaxID=1529436 RepID=UPI00142559CF|nr:DNA topoisomerase 3-beta-1-like [Anneissia japonica]
MSVPIQPASTPSQREGLLSAGSVSTGFWPLMSTQPKWKMVCNRCSFMVRLFTDAHKIALVADSRCEGCNAAIMSVEFNKVKTPLGKETHHSGCAFCDPIFSSH